jgi:hypothetical protein
MNELCLTAARGLRLDQIPAFWLFNLLVFQPARKEGLAAEETDQTWRIYQN